MFLTTIAVLGMILSNFIPDIISKILNVLVGLVIMGLGIKLLVKKKEKTH